MLKTVIKLPNDFRQLADDVHRRFEQFRRKIDSESQIGNGVEPAGESVLKKIVILRTNDIQSFNSKNA
jgi:hypothetical protein